MIGTTRRHTRARPPFPNKVACIPLSCLLKNSPSSFFFVSVSASLSLSLSLQPPFYRTNMHASFAMMVCWIRRRNSLAELDAAAAALPGKLSLEALDVHERLGSRSTPVPGSRYYGCQSAVFAASTKVRRGRGGGGGSGSCGGDGDVGGADGAANGAANGDAGGDDGRGGGGSDGKSGVEKGEGGGCYYWEGGSDTQRQPLPSSSSSSPSHYTPSTASSALPVAIKVMFNGGEVDTADLAEDFRSDYAINSDSARLPYHPNVLRYVPCSMVVTTASQ